MIVPELEDPTKDSSKDDSSDISQQANESNIQAPVAAADGGGQAVGNGAATTAKQPSSSGSFQDFSKFKTANASKLSALSNLATGQATTNANNSASAFDNAGSAFQSDINSKAKNFDTSGFANLGKDSTLDVTKLGADLNDTSKIDAGDYKGKLAGTDEYTNLQNTENQLGKFGTREGTASVLGDYGNSDASGGNYSSGAANQDALLLQSMGDYRQKANAVAQASKGMTANELAAQQAGIDKVATATNANNATYHTKALDALSKLHSTLDTDLSDRAAAATTANTSQVNAQVAAAKAKIEADARATLGQTAYHGPVSNAAVGQTVYQNSTGQYLTAAERAQNGTKADLSKTGSLEDLAGAVGYDPNTYNSVFQDYTSKNLTPITADNIYAGDAQRQAQINALNQLLGSGKNYNGSAMMPVQTQLDTSSATQKLLAALQAKIAASDSRTNGGLNAPAVVTGANSNVVKSTKVTNTNKNLG